MFHTTSDQMNNWRWEKPRAFGDQFDLSNPQATSLGKVQRTGVHFCWYGSNNLRAKIELPSCWQYKPGGSLAVTQLNWDGIIDEDDDDDNWADPGALSGGRSLLGDGNGNDDCKSEEDKQGGEKGTGNWKGTKDGKVKGKATEDGKGKGKVKGTGHGKGKGIAMHTPGGDDISRAVALQLQKKISESDLDTEG
jgi:hypothetical protein